MSYVEELEAYARDLAIKTEALLNIYEAMPKIMPFNAALEIETDDGRLLSVSKKQMKEKKLELLHDLEKGIPKQFRKFRKASRKPQPSQFKGVYKPVVVHKGLCTFLKEVDLGTVDLDNPLSDAVIDHIPCIQQGYGLRNSFQLLLYLAHYVGGCQNPEHKNVFNPTDQIQALMAKCSCAYINQYNADGKAEFVVNSEKKSMTEVLQHRVEVLDQKPFDSNALGMHMFTILLSLCIYKPKDLSKDILTSLENEDLRAQLLKEYELIKSVSEQWKKKKENAKSSS
jgi:hypothetical protein